MITDIELTVREDVGFALYTDRLQSAGLSRSAVLADFAAAAGGRFEYTRALLRRHAILPTSVLRPHHCRAAEHAQNLRNKGNEHYRARDYAEATLYYTHSALLTRPGTVPHALALGNRSAALFRSADYQGCVDDVRRALLSGYPVADAHKLYERAGDAELLLGRPRGAHAMFAEGLRRVENHPTTTGQITRDRLRNRVAVAAAACDRLPPERQQQQPQPGPGPRLPVPEDRLLGGRHDKVPAFSSCLELGWSPTTGRGVYATCDIDPGATVAVEEPYVSFSINTCYYSGCLKMSLSNILCPNCCIAYYCNEECLQKDLQNGHNVECPILFSVKTLPGNSTLNALALKWFLKGCNKFGIEEYCSVINNMNNTKIDPILVGFDENGQFKSDNFLTAYTMRNCAKKMPLDVLFFMHCVAVDILEYLMLSGFKIPKRCIITAGASLVQMLCVLDLNCDKIGIHNPNIQQEDSLFPTALCLYPAISLFNHSCAPNVKSSGLLSDKTRVLKAIQFIPKGSQLFISYGIGFIKTDTNSRLTYCMENFKFTCTCQPCCEKWPSGRFIPNRLSALNLKDPKMGLRLSLECKKLSEFMKATKPEDLHKHLNYLYYINKLIFSNVKRPFALYEDSLFMLDTAHRKSDSLPFFLCRLKIYLNLIVSFILLEPTF